ncbi:MAG: N-acetylmuramoyl-L-alanine amidase [Beijerinckiaceae bacterium]
MLTHISQAGPHKVQQIDCPHFSTPANLHAPRAGVLHTTEGGFAGSMSVFNRHFAPHFIVGLNAGGKPEIAQLVPVGVIGAALVTHNNKALVQIEMVGFAKETPWLPDAATLDALAALMLVCRSEWGIPLSHPWPDGDYGRAGHNPHRTSGKFGAVAGWFGHADVPDPDTHWDPGNLEWSKIFAHAEAIK